MIFRKNMDNNFEFGQFISEQRHMLSMESQELAKALGILNAYLPQLEKGIHIIPISDLLDKIAKCKNRNDFLFFYLLRSALSGTEIFYQN